MDLRPFALPVALATLAAIVLLPLRSEAATATPPAPPPRLPIVPGGAILSRFGPRSIRGVAKQHNGIDLSAPRGTPVRSPLDGTVVAVYPDGEVSGYGNLVTVRHGDIGLLYAHLDAITVRAGDAVAAGQQVGTIGSTDSTEGGFSSSGAHLHLEVIVPTPGQVDTGLTHFTGSTPPRVDPEPWADAQGVRLV